MGGPYMAIADEECIEMIEYDKTDDDTPEPEKESNNILLIVGIAAGSLILLAIVIPLVVFMCRNCCCTGAVAPDDDRDEEEQIKKKDKFRRLDENENNTTYKDNRRFSTDTLLSIDQYDEAAVTNATRIRSRHRRLSKRALSYTSDGIEKDALKIQNKIFADKGTQMRVDSILELQELDNDEDDVFKDKNVQTDDDMGDKSKHPGKHISNIYVHNVNYQNKIFPHKKRKVSPIPEKNSPVFDESVQDEHTRSLTAFSVVPKPSQTTPRVVMFESLSF